MTHDPHDPSRERNSLERYHPPPPFPAESLWDGIDRQARRRRTLNVPPRWAAAAAVVVFIGGAAAGASMASRDDGAPSAVGDFADGPVAAAGAQPEATPTLVVWF